MSGTIPLNTRILLLVQRRGVPVIPFLAHGRKDRIPIAGRPVCGNSTRRLEEGHSEALAAVPGNMAMQQPYSRVIERPCHDDMSVWWHNGCVATGWVSPVPTLC
jgi:hypothetical protein